MSMPAVFVPPLGFVNVEPQQGWSNGVPALRQRNSFACSSFSLVGDSSPSPSFASRTSPSLLLARYLNEICLRDSCLTLPLASITVTSVTILANSAPLQPAFIYIP